MVLLYPPILFSEPRVGYRMAVGETAEDDRAE